MQKSLLTETEIAKMERFCEGTSGYFYQMLEYIFDWMETGIEEGRFTRKRAEHDLEIALWIAYACGNIDDYEHYYMSMMWLRDVEDLAAGCGVYYYRYSCALLYCGKLKEALAYAEKGVQEEPEYPWGWLNLARLRSHFGDQHGALEANSRGLALVPGDYEFLRQEEELKRGCTLEEMEMHYIAEEDDRQLLSGALGEQVEQNKLSAISGIVCDEEKLEKIKQMLQAENWEADQPYCTFTFCHGDVCLEGMFRMNEAAVSKLSPAWIRGVLDTLDLRDQEERQNVAQQEALDADQLILCQVVWERDYTVTMRYAYPHLPLAESAVYGS